jgi:Chalcone isomerase-like
VEQRRLALPRTVELSADDPIGSGDRRLNVRIGAAGGSARAWLIAALLVALPLAANASPVADIQLAERVTVDASDLVLNGAGLRKKLLFRVYVVGLYLPERRQSPVDVFALPGPKRVSILLLRPLPARRLVDALEVAIRRNSSLEQYRAVKGRLVDLFERMLSVVEGEKGDIVTFDWLPGEGTTVALNGVPRGAPIPGADVYAAVLNAWLGERPLSAGLKEALLGLTN